MSSEPLTLSHTVTPGPAVLRKMGLSWTLFSPAGAHLATFSYGPAGELPGPESLSLTPDQAEDLAAAGYLVKDAGPGIDPLGGAAPEPVKRRKPTEPPAAVDSE